MRLRVDFADPASVGSGGGPTPREFTRPRELFIARKVTDVEAVLRAAEAAAVAGAWVVGFLSYEAASAFDSALVTHASNDLPLAWFAAFDEPSAPAASREPHEAAFEQCAWKSRISEDEYRQGFAAVRSAIAAGDVYQANYTHQLDAHWDDDRIWPRYLSLLAAHRPPYAACLDLGDVAVLSLSPELLLQRKGRRVATAPMKGTARRGRWRDEDIERREALAVSEKDRAENVMIVDLARNDLGRVCELGSIEVTSLFDVQRYRAAWQMVSTVTGTLRAEATLTDVFRSVFPAGSITGAPKVSAMQLIREIEPFPRGVYCGAIGMLVPGGDAIFNVAIRTAVFERASRHVSLGVGGGITWDSTPTGEFVEARLKAAFLEPPPLFSLLETMRSDGAMLVRRPQHLQRLRDSALFFDIAVDEDRLTDAIEAHLALWLGIPRRVKIVVDQNGEPTVSSRTLDATPSPARVALSKAPVTAEDVFLCHKTTNRAVYESRRSERPDVFDVLLQNEHGQLTEFTVGNLVVEIDGERLTPHREAGLLPGVFRNELIAAGVIHECPLTTADLDRASALWLINSVREWVPVTLTS